MAVVKMKRFTLITFQTYRKELLEALQNFGCVEFQAVEKDEEELAFKDDYSAIEVAHLESELLKIQYMLDKLSVFQPKLSALNRLKTEPLSIDYMDFQGFLETFDYEKIYQELRQLDEKMKKVDQEIQKLRADISSLQIYKEFDATLSECNALQFTEALFTSVPTRQASAYKEELLHFSDLIYIEEYLHAEEHLFFILFPKALKQTVYVKLKNLGLNSSVPQFMKTAKECITEKEKEIKERIKEHEKLGHCFSQFSSSYDKLCIAFDGMKASLERANIRNLFAKTDHTFVCSGYVGEDEEKDLTKLIHNICNDSYEFVSEKVLDDDENVPIRLKNSKMVSVFENITEMYSFPRYQEIDPTPYFVPFYMMFFGIMIGDSGYGLVFFLAGLLLPKLFYFNSNTQKFIKFFYYLSFPTMLAGLLFGSFFGFPYFQVIPCAESESGYKAILDAAFDIPLMLILSIFIGYLQIQFGLFIKCFVLLKEKKIWDAIADSLTWIVLLISLPLTFYLKDAFFQQLAVITTVLCLVILLLTQGRENKTFIGKLAGGLYGVYGLSSYVGDLISYTRLVALSLSGAYIAFSFRMIAEIIPSGILRAIFGSLIIVLGGIFNLALGALGAYVHTCRLQYVEFFSKFYDGGGRAFQAFSIKNRYVNIKNKKDV